MPTLAQMLGAATLPQSSKGNDVIRFRESDRPPLVRGIEGSEDGFMQRMIDLQEALLMQTAIGK